MLLIEKARTTAPRPVVSVRVNGGRISWLERDFHAKGPQILLHCCDNS